MKKRLTAQQIEEMAFEIRRFLIDHRLWINACIFFGGKAFATFDKFDDEKTISNNNPEQLFVIENAVPYEHLRCESNILCMSFEGPLFFFLGEHFALNAACLDNRDKNDNLTELDAARLFVQKGLMDIFKKRGLVYVMQTDYKLTARYYDDVIEEQKRRLREGENPFISQAEARKQDPFVKEHILTKLRAEPLTGETIEIPPKYSKIGGHAFAFRKDIKSIIIPEGVSEISNAAFLCCENLAYIEIPDSVVKIEAAAFEETPWYDNHPNYRVVYAGKVAYSYKGDMPENADIILRDGTTAIADEAFNDSKLAYITVPNSVTYIGKGQFENCNELFRNNVTFRCREGSYAHQYAKENGISVDLIGNYTSVK